MAEEEVKLRDKVREDNWLLKKGSNIIFNTKASSFRITRGEKKNSPYQAHETG